MEKTDANQQRTMVHFVPSISVLYCLHHPIHRTYTCSQVQFLSSLHFDFFLVFNVLDTHLFQDSPSILVAQVYSQESTSPFTWADNCPLGAPINLVQVDCNAFKKSLHAAQLSGSDWPHKRSFTWLFTFIGWCWIKDVISQ